MPKHPEPQIVTLDQFRDAAKATGLLASTEGPYLTTGENRQYAAVFLVTRQFASGEGGTVKRTYESRVELEESFRRTPGWQSAPLKALGEVAEAAAYRMAFKTELGSCWLADEVPVTSGPKRGPVAMRMLKPVQLTPVFGAVA